MREQCASPDVMHAAGGDAAEKRACVTRAGGAWCGDGRHRLVRALLFMRQARALDVLAPRRHASLARHRAGRARNGVMRSHGAAHQDGKLALRGAARAAEGRRSARAQSQRIAPCSASAPSANNAGRAAGLRRNGRVKQTQRLRARALTPGEPA